MSKTNRFHVKKIEENKITVEEERKYRSPIALFFIRNGKLIFCISLLFSITVFIIAFYFIISNIKDSSIVKYESNGVVVIFDESDSSILNGTPITNEYASKVFDSVIESNYSDVGVVIKLGESVLKDRTIVFYSDKTALIKYNNGGFLIVYSVNNDYGVNEEGMLNKNASTERLNGKIETNDKLGISMLYLSNGSVEVTRDNDTFFIRNSDITNTQELFYTNLSGVSLPIKEENDKIFYSDGTIRENNYVIVDNNKYSIKEVKEIHNNIKIIYYENGYAEIIRGDLSVMVKNSNHIFYDNNILEIIDNSIREINIEDIMDIKKIELENTSTEANHYIVVLEETSNYDKHNISKRLDNRFINFNIYVNGEKKYNNVLNNNLKGSNILDGATLSNNTYLLYEGNIDKLSTVSLKIGMWINYENITNEYMNSAFIGTVKVYIESLN